jgi:hypothetical protein
MMITGPVEHNQGNLLLPALPALILESTYQMIGKSLHLQNSTIYNSLLGIIKTNLIIVLTRFLYSLHIATDANFCLKNRFKAGSQPNPGLGTGWAYFLENVAYKAFLSNYISEKDVGFS